jgi:hypothetical protein
MIAPGLRRQHGRRGTLDHNRRNRPRRRGIPVEQLGGLQLVQTPRFDIFLDGREVHERTILEPTSSCLEEPRSIRR